MTKATENNCWVIRECRMFKSPRLDLKTKTYHATLDGDEYAWPARLINHLAYGGGTWRDLYDDRYLADPASEAARRGVML